jgi:hypothetical protein
MLTNTDIERRKRREEGYLMAIPWPQSEVRTVCLQSFET